MHLIYHLYVCFLNSGSFLHPSLYHFLALSPDGRELCLHPEEPLLSFGCRDIPWSAGRVGGAGWPALWCQWPWWGEFWLLGQEEEEKEGIWSGKERDNRRCWVQGNDGDPDGFNGCSWLKMRRWWWLWRALSVQNPFQIQNLPLVFRTGDSKGHNIWFASFLSSK